LKKQLTDRFIETVVPPASGRAVYIDAKAPGLELRVSPDGRKSWSIRYRPKGGERKRETYGIYPAKTLADARRRALAIAAKAVDGIDLPATEDLEREAARKAAARPQTVGDLLDRYVESYCKPNQRKWQQAERIFETHVKPTLGQKPLTELRRADIAELLDDLQNEKGFRAQVNRVRSHIVAALNWAIEREWIEVNPAAAIKKRRLETSRDRVLSNDELRAIWRAADTLSEPRRPLVMAWILTGQRRDEVRCMTWGEVDLSRAVWTLPAARNKGKRDHEIPLAPAMLELLGKLPRRGDAVFTIDGVVPYSAYKRLKVALDRGAGVTGWRLHDLRRTASTGMAALHIPQDTIDRVLNHAKPVLSGTYNRHRYLDEKRSALEAWAEHVAFIVGEARNDTRVVQIAAAR
jgi:integrase